MSATREAPTRSTRLRILGVFGVFAGLAYAAVSIFTAVALSTGTQGLEADEILLSFVIGALSLLLAMAGLCALISASRPSLAAGMAKTNKTLMFLGIAVAGVGSVAVVMMDSSWTLFIVPIAGSILALLLTVSLLLRYLLRLPEALTARDSSAPS